MIKNFDELKPQLKELAEIVNAFKSEAVQLRIVELVFESASAETKPAPAHGDNADRAQKRSPSSKRAARKKTRNGDAATAASPKSSRGGKLGAHAAFARMFDDGFFKGHKRKISDVVQHAETNLATKFKSSDVSGVLARYTRDKKLTRSKNTDNQYEYTQA